MDVKQLNYFVRVAEMGSFSKAAAALSVAQPALSRQIRNLEEELSTQLLYRNGRGVLMTDAGRLLYERVTGILEELDRVRHDIGELAGVASGTVTLGTPPTVSSVLVTPVIKRIREKHPQVSLQVVEAFSGYVNEWLANGRLDVAVLYNAPRTRHLRTEKLLKESLFLITKGTGVENDAPAPPVRFQDLVGLPLILPSRPHGLRLLVDEFAGKAGLSLTVTFEIDALPAIKDLVEEGVAATVLPFASVHREVRRGRMQAAPIRDPALTRTLVLATSSQRPLTLASRAVVAELKAAVANLVGSGAWLGTA